MSDDSETDENPFSEGDDDPNDSDYEEEKPLKSQRIKRCANGKWKVYYDKKTFKSELLDLFPWVEADPLDAKMANCTACNKKLKAHKGILDTHQKTKKHLKNLYGSDNIGDDDEPKKSEKSMDHNPVAGTSTANPYSSLHSGQMMEQLYTDDQFGLFSESPMDSAHQAITGLIDKLVEKYHENRVENLRIQNEAILQLSMEKATARRLNEQRELELKSRKMNLEREARELDMQFKLQQHETRMNVMEAERDAKLKAVEQQLMFARQEYEKKVKLLDQQLQFIK